MRRIDHAGALFRASTVRLLTWLSMLTRLPLKRLGNWR